MSKLKTKLIKYSKKLNITNLSALRSGNISVRAREKGVEGFLITPSGMKYTSLKPKDIVFVSLTGVFDKNKIIPHQNGGLQRYLGIKKGSQKLYTLFISSVLRQSHHIKRYLPFTTWLQ